MKRLLNWLSRKRHPYEPLITMCISKARLLHNLSEFQKLAPNGIVAPVLKSNAYGHGLIEVAKILESTSMPGVTKIPFFVVDSYFEALALRARGIDTPILVIGYNHPETILGCSLKNVSFTITSIQALEKISHTKKKIFLHLKIDTGMRRQGISFSETEKATAILQLSPNLILDGICSHLSDADNDDNSFTSRQISLWNEIIEKFRKLFPDIRYIHLSATDGHLFNKKIIANVSRLGLGLYGVSSNAKILKALDLKPIMEIKTSIAGIRTLKIGETIGYGNTFKAVHDMTIANIPFGYYEGLDRRLSNKGYVLVGPSRIPCPIIGRISMNITSIDITGVNAEIGTEVVVISRNRNDPNSISAISSLCTDTIPYELLVKIPPHLKRVVS